MRREWHTIPTYVYTEDGVWNPGEVVEWPAGQAYEEFLADRGLTVAGPWEQGIRGAVTEADVFRRVSTGEIVIDLRVMGVGAWIECATAAAFYKFAREWLMPLAGLNSADDDGYSDERRAANVVRFRVPSGAA
jgi:hypothetical protein